MDIIASTHRYDKWQGSLIKIVPEDRQKKHDDMAADLLPHLRSTYYRWAELFPLVCPDLAELFAVLSAGDEHLGNIGTYRDAEARLILANNDKDEAWIIPWPNDLVRLATSTVFASIGGHIDIGFADLCEAILAGYGKGLEKGAMPFVLSEKHAKLRRLAHTRLRDPKLFWKKVRSLPAAKHVPATARRVLENALPDVKEYEIYSRTAGEGSLGRQRFVAVAMYKGGWVAREVKAYMPSAHAMLEGVKNPPNYYVQLIEQSADCPDPFLHVENGWVCRRLSPDCSKFDLAQLAAVEDEWVLLKAMGRSVLNLHGANPKHREKIRKEFKKLPSNWLKKGSLHMAEEVRADFAQWRKFMNSRED